MRFDIFTLLPEVIAPYLEASILLKARERGLVNIYLHNIRNWTKDRHHITDDEPYGGGGGMVMKPEPIFAAIESVLGAPPACPVVLLTPQGRVFNQTIAQEFAEMELSAISEGKTAQIALLCGRYEGVDERVREHLVTDEISLGDYVITGGELAAMVVVDAVSRLLPGVLGDPDGASDDSHASGLLEYPHYTRPAVFRGWEAPAVLLSGNHAQIARWRREQALLRTWQRRPDLLQKANLSEADRLFLASLDDQNSLGKLSASIYHSGDEGVNEQ